MIGLGVFAVVGWLVTDNEINSVVILLNLINCVLDG